MLKFIKETIFSENTLDLAAILTFLAAIFTLLINAINNYWKEKTIRNNNEAQRIAQEYIDNKEILPHLRTELYNLYFAYKNLMDCEYIKVKKTNCRSVCKRTIFHKITCLMKSIMFTNTDILTLISIELSPDLEYSDSRNKYENFVYIFIESIKSCSKFIETNPFPRLSKKHIKELSKLYYDLLLFIQLKDSPQKNHYCIHFHNLELLIKHITYYN